MFKRDVLSKYSIMVVSARIKTVLTEDGVEFELSKGMGELICQYLDYDALDYWLDGADANSPDRAFIIDHIEVKPEFRGRGFAEELMKAALTFAKSKKFEVVYLNASPIGSHMSKSRLVNFYKRFGFKEILNQGGNSIMKLKIKK